MVASAQVRFDGLLRGGVAATGNTLGLSSGGADRPGTDDSAGTFTARDPAARDGAAWPEGTTADWRANGSSAVLDLPAGAEVVYAELFWGGSYAYGGEDVTAFLDEPVQLSHAGDGVSSSVAPDPVTASTTSITSGSFSVRYYGRSADVTTMVREHGAGTWSAAGIPATQSVSVRTANAAGWSLYVVYRDATAPVRRVRIVSTGEWVGVDTTAEHEMTSCAPGAGSLIVSAIEGDARRTGDRIEAGALGSLVALSGPNNPVGNPFASQLNGADGRLDVRGSFGTANHDAASALEVSGGRQGFDLTVLSLAGALPTRDVPLLVRASTEDDEFMLGPFALVLDEEASELDVGTTAVAEASMGSLGETFTVTLTLVDDRLGASGVSVAVPLPAGWSLVAMRVDGVVTAVDAPALAAGVVIGDVARGVARSIELDVRADELAPFIAEATIRHAHPTCAAQPTTSFAVLLPRLEVRAPGDDASVADAAAALDGGRADGGSVAVEDGGRALDAGGGGVSAGCGCSAVAGTIPRAWWLLLVSAGLLARRRR